ncbi:MAG: hypothetical protein V4446_01100 [Pseudomonadota bacterium]
MIRIGPSSATNHTQRPAAPRFFSEVYVTAQRALMQFFVFIMMEDQLPQFDLDGFAQRLLAHVHRLEQPLAILQPAVAELFLVKTLLGFHGSRLS